MKDNLLTWINPIIGDDSPIKTIIPCSRENSEIVIKFTQICHTVTIPSWWKEVASFSQSSIIKWSIFQPAMFDDTRGYTLQWRSLLLWHGSFSQARWNPWTEAILRWEQHHSSVSDGKHCTFAKICPTGRCQKVEHPTRLICQMCRCIYNLWCASEIDLKDVFGIIIDIHVLFIV